MKRALALVGMAMQKEIDGGSQSRSKVARIPQVLVVIRRAALEVVVHDADSQPTTLDLRLEPLLEPSQLAFADPSVMVFIAMALAHRRVEPRDYQS